MHSLNIYLHTLYVHLCEKSVTRTYVCVYVCICVCMHTNTHAHGHTQTHTTNLRVLVSVSLVDPSLIQRIMSCHNAEFSVSWGRPLHVYVVARKNYTFNLKMFFRPRYTPHSPFTTFNYTGLHPFTVFRFLTR